MYHTAMNPLRQVSGAYHGGGNHHKAGNTLQPILVLKSPTQISKKNPKFYGGIPAQKGSNQTM